MTFTRHQPGERLRRPSIAARGCSVEQNECVGAISDLRSPVWFDSHVHVDHLDETAADFMCERAACAGVQAIVAVGGTPEMNLAAVRLAAKRPGQVAATVGWDRSMANRPPNCAQVWELAKRPDVVAIGETGLDYHYGADTADAQRRLLYLMLDMARELQKPVVVHTREAEADTVAALRAHTTAWQGPSDRLGVIHCFTGTWPFAASLLDLGWYISFSGIVTFRTATALREVVARIPADRLLIETDTPWLAPEPHRGSRNEPAYVVEVGRAVAAARGQTVDEIAELTWQNAVRLFNWPPPK